MRTLSKILLAIICLAIFFSCAGLPRPKAGGGEGAELHLGPYTSRPMHDAEVFEIFYGSVGRELKNPLDEPWNLVITLDDEHTLIKDIVEKELENEQWVMNLPKGLITRILSASAGGKKIEIAVDGIPLEPRNMDPVVVKIPGKYIGGAGAVSVSSTSTTTSTSTSGISSGRGGSDLIVPNQFVVFHIIDVQGNIPAVISNAQYKLSGFVDVPLAPQTIELKLINAVLEHDIEDGTELPWFTNLPEGLSAHAKTAAKGESVIKFVISGVPLKSGSGDLRVTIPADSLSPAVAITNREIFLQREIIITTNRKSLLNPTASETKKTTTAEVITYKYEIGLKEIYAFSHNTSNTMYQPNWRGNYEQLNYPYIPRYKDFEGLGIIWKQATRTETLGNDDQYEWSGEEISYNDLMLEAKKIGAHAIINSTIEYKDDIKYTLERYLLEEGHQMSEQERRRLQSGVLRRVIIDDKEYAEMTIRTTKRTYTGTALAIKYLNGTDFYEGEIVKNQNTDGTALEIFNANEKPYIPSFPIIEDEPKETGKR